MRFYLVDLTPVTIVYFNEQWAKHASVKTKYLHKGILSIYRLIELTRLTELKVNRCSKLDSH